MENPPIYSARLHAALQLAGGLAEVAQAMVTAAQKQVAKSTRIRRGQTLRPGPHTPMWNALATAVYPLVHRRYGAQSKLARILGVPPQRVHDYLVARRATPDAERTLQLLVWLAQRKAGIDPS
jgi:hypothetical protein